MNRDNEKFYMRYFARIVIMVGLTALIVLADAVINYWTFT